MTLNTLNDAIDRAKTSYTIPESSEFILLDLREADYYTKCHIKGAVSFPATNLTKDKFHPDVFRLRNQEGKLIIVYTQEERTGVESAQIFTQKNYDNIFLLSGGLFDFYIKYPQLVIGDTQFLDERIEINKLNPRYKN